MNIAVCMKQVPAYHEGNMDEKTGVLIRNGLETIVNKYDLAALETALKIKEQLKETVKVTVFTMGPSQAEHVIKEAFAIGADEGYLICDKAFAGADVLATSYTLMQAIDFAGHFELILCGKQTTDGDTAQVSGALAKWLNIPHINWVCRLVGADEKKAEIEYYMGNHMAAAQIEYPCLLSVELDIFPVRMPSLKLKLKSRSKPVGMITQKDLFDTDQNNYGLLGSATRVKKIYPPKKTKRKEMKKMTGTEAANYIQSIINAKM